jgi:cholesterol oxidase
MKDAAGAGVGGGSLIYANISVEAKPWFFEKGWPPNITYEMLTPYYETVGKMLNLQELPDNQLTARFNLMIEAATAAGNGDQFRQGPGLWLPGALCYRRIYHSNGNGAEPVPHHRSLGRIHRR